MRWNITEHLVNWKNQANRKPLIVRGARQVRKSYSMCGMPECVSTFAETTKMKDVYNIQSDLVATYRQDFSKYQPQVDKRCLNDVLFSVARRVGQPIKYAALSDNFSNPTIKKAFELLATARLIHKVRASVLGWRLSV